MAEPASPSEKRTAPSGETPVQVIGKLALQEEAAVSRIEKACGLHLGRIPIGQEKGRHPLVGSPGKIGNLQAVLTVALVSNPSGREILKETRSSGSGTGGSGACLAQAASSRPRQSSKTVGACVMPKMPNVPG